MTDGLPHLRDSKPSPDGEDGENLGVNLAAAWLAAEPDPPRPIVPYLRERFGLSAKDACAAIARASEQRDGAASQT